MGDKKKLESGGPSGASWLKKSNPMKTKSNPRKAKAKKESSGEAPDIKALLTERDAIERRLADASKRIRAFPRDAMGLPAESIRTSPEYRVAKAAVDQAFQALRAFNTRTKPHWEAMRLATRKPYPMKSTSNPRASKGRTYEIWEHSTNGRWRVSHPDFSGAVSPPDGFSTPEQAERWARDWAFGRGEGESKFMRISADDADLRDDNPRRNKKTKDKIDEMVLYGWLTPKQARNARALERAGYAQHTAIALARAGGSMEENPRRAVEADASAAGELILWIDNSKPLYRQWQAIVKNLHRHQARGNFSQSRAADGFEYLAEAGAKDYFKNFGSSGMRWHDMFDVTTRRAVAEEYAQSFVNNARDESNYASARKNPSTGWDVFLDGKKIDTVFYSGNDDADDVRRSLIDHDGYDSRITVRKMRARKNPDGMDLSRSSPSTATSTHATVYAQGGRPERSSNPEDFKITPKQWQGYFEMHERDYDEMSKERPDPGGGTGANDVYHLDKYGITSEQYRSLLTIAEEASGGAKYVKLATKSEIQKLLRGLRVSMSHGDPSWTRADPRNIDRVRRAFAGSVRNPIVNPKASVSGYDHQQTSADRLARGDHR